MFTEMYRCLTNLIQAAAPVVAHWSRWTKLLYAEPG